MRRNRLSRLSAAQELFVENLVAVGGVYVIQRDCEELGYAITDRGDLVVEFHLEDPNLSHAELAIDELIKTLGVRRMLVQTFDPLPMSVCSMRGSLVVRDLLYRIIADPNFEPRSEIVTRLATPADVPELAALSDDFFCDEREIIAYLRADGPMVYRDPCGNLIGAGVMKRVIPGSDGVDIGMVVKPQLRRRGYGGYGGYIVRRLKAHCLAQGLQPICGCSIDNVASQRALQRGGFASVHRLVELTL